MQLLTAKEVAATMNLRLARVYELTREGVLPSIRVGRRQLRYDLIALSEWAKQGGNLAPEVRKENQDARR